MCPFASLAVATLLAILPAMSYADIITGRYGYQGSGFQSTAAGEGTIIVNTPLAGQPDSGYLTYSFVIQIMSLNGSPTLTYDFAGSQGERSHVSAYDGNVEITVLGSIPTRFQASRTPHTFFKHRSFFSAMERTKNLELTPTSFGLIRETSSMS